MSKKCKLKLFLSPKLIQANGLLAHLGFQTHNRSGPKMTQLRPTGTDQNFFILVPKLLQTPLIFRNFKGQLGLSRILYLTLISTVFAFVIFHNCGYRNRNRLFPQNNNFPVFLPLLRFRDHVFSACIVMMILLAYV